MAIRFYNEDCNYRLEGKRLICSWIRAAIEEEGFAMGDISYIFCSPERHIGINRQYLGHDYYTDVITFDYSGAEQGSRNAEDPVMCSTTGSANSVHEPDYNAEEAENQTLPAPRRAKGPFRLSISGDIFIDPATVASNAAEYGATPREEMLRVLVHGVLHLCGYKDKSETEALLMREKENYYLAKFQ